MTHFDLGMGQDTDLLVFADWLEDQDNPDCPSLVRQMVEELRAVDAALADLRDRGHVRPGLLRLFPRGDLARCKIVLTNYIPLPGHSGRRGGGGLVADDSTVGTRVLAGWTHRAILAPACGELVADGTDKHQWMVMDVLMRRYGFRDVVITDEAGTFELTNP